MKDAIAPISVEITMTMLPFLLRNTQPQIKG